MTNLRLRIGLVVALVGIFAFLSLANLVPEKTRVASPLLPDSGLRLGLDLQGGIHWVLGVKLSAAVEHELEFLGGNLQAAAESGDFVVGDVDEETMTAMRTTLATGHGPYPFGASRGRRQRRRGPHESEPSA